MTRWPPPRRVPFWCELALVAGVALVVRLAGLDADAAPPVVLGFFGWLVVVAQGIWTALQVAGQVVLHTLVWLVNAAWIVIRELGQGIAFFGRKFLEAGKHIWRFFRDTYTHVLRPAWVKFFRFVDWARSTLVDLFEPVVTFLNAVRRELLKVYFCFIRPVLDTISVARRVLGLFRTLGFEWAAALDAKLAAVDDWISARFGQILGKLNEVINVVNRVVTADGLFQRLALVRSIERDMAYLTRSFFRLTTRPQTDAEREAARAQPATKTAPEHADELRRALETRDGPIAYKGEEFIADLTILLRDGRAR